MPIALVDEQNPIEQPMSPTSAMVGGEGADGELEEDAPITGAETREFKPMLGFLPPPEKRTTMLRVRKSKGHKGAFKASGAEG